MILLWYFYLKNITVIYFRQERDYTIQLLTLRVNSCCRWCIATFITSFTPVFSSFTSVYMGEHQLTSINTLMTVNLDPRHYWWRSPWCITRQSHIATFCYCVIFYCLYGRRHCEIKVETKLQTMNHFSQRCSLNTKTEWPIGPELIPVPVALSD